ncbi:hypothetical protein [Microbulbifer sp. JMSA008]|uniref:hypothetical protein n=1 Tax=Microbulbifer sp. JMSA008 TaxID=3243373 RepID=UPI004039FD0F
MNKYFTKPRKITAKSAAGASYRWDFVGGVMPHATKKKLMSEYEKSIKLFGDYSFESKFDEDDEDNDFLYMYFYSKKFSRLMAELFGEENSPFWGYLPRKLREDQEGCLAFASPMIEESNNESGEAFINAGEEIDAEEYFNIVHSIDTPDKLLAHLFKFDKNMVAVIERYWVFLYLCCESGLTEVSRMLTDAEIQYRNHWGTAKELDEGIVKQFIEAYEKI